MHEPEQVRHRTKVMGKINIEAMKTTIVHECETCGRTEFTISLLHVLSLRDTLTRIADELGLEGQVTTVTSGEAMVHADSEHSLEDAIQKFEDTPISDYKAVVDTLADKHVSPWDE